MFPPLSTPLVAISLHFVVVLVPRNREAKHGKDQQQPDRHLKLPDTARLLPGHRHCAVVPRASRHGMRAGPATAPPRPRHLPLRRISAGLRGLMFSCVRLPVDLPLRVVPVDPCHVCLHDVRLNRDQQGCRTSDSWEGVQRVQTRRLLALAAEEGAGLADLECHRRLLEGGEGLRPARGCRRHEGHRVLPEKPVAHSGMSYVLSLSTIAEQLVCDLLIKVKFFVTFYPMLIGLYPNLI